MNGTVFNIGVTTCGFTMATIVEHHPQNVIGTFWLPSTEKDYNKLTVKLLTMMGKKDAGIIKIENLHQDKNIQSSVLWENFKPF